MENKEKMQNEVYTPMKELKERFYASKTQDEWDGCKKELTALLDKAKEMMTEDFYPKYKQGVIDSISKMYTFKEKYFSKKQYVAQPKQSFIFREDEGKSFARLCNALAEYIEKKLQN